MKKKKIVVIGSCNTDMVIKSDHLPSPGETILGGTFMMNSGGKGANQSVAAARLGGDVTFICKTGNDSFGRQSVELYDSESINTDYIFRDATLPSGVALIMVDSRGENSIVVASGANAALNKSDIDKTCDTIAAADFLLMQLEIPIETVVYAARIAHKNKVKVILNPAPARQMPDELYESLYIIAPNRTEAEILSGVKVTDWESARQAAKILSDKGVDIVIITLGSMGALVKQGSRYAEIPVARVNAVDTTAAGDTFCGALCVGLSEGMDIFEAVRFANKASGITVTRMGAQASLPYRAELEAQTGLQPRESMAAATGEMMIG